MCLCAQVIWRALRGPPSPRAWWCEWWIQSISWLLFKTLHTFTSFTSSTSLPHCSSPYFCRHHILVRHRIFVDMLKYICFIQAPSSTKKHDLNMEVKKRRSHHHRITTTTGLPEQHVHSQQDEGQRHLRHPRQPDAALHSGRHSRGPPPEGELSLSSKIILITLVT